MPHIEFTRPAPDGQPIYFQGWSPDAEPRAVVCLVHGLGDHSGRYAHVAKALNEAGHALLAFDLRGHGKTPGRRGYVVSYQAVMEDIGRLLDEAAAWFPAAPRFLYGHSLGGNLVLNYSLRCAPDAIAAQVRGVIATSPALGENKTPPLQRVLGKIMYRVKPDFVMANGLELATLTRDPQVLDAYYADPLVHNRISARMGLDLLDSMGWASAHAAGFPPVPLLLTHGTADRITSVAATKAFAGQANCECTLKLWDECYHETHNEPEKNQVLDFMVRWINDHLPASN